MPEKMTVTLLLLAALWQLLPAAEPAEIVIDGDLQLVKMADDLYLHRCWVEDEKFGRFSCNGLLILREKEALLIDSPWNSDQTRRLARYLEKEYGARIVLLIPGHSHQDCLGGLEYLQKAGARCLAGERTIAICRSMKLPVPDQGFNERLDFNFHGLEISCRYFGPGHTSDNITVWLPDRKMLFGGCLVRSADSTGLGYVKEADLDHWDETVENLLEAYPHAAIVVPGHGAPGGPELLRHTIELVKLKRAKNSNR